MAIKTWLRNLWHAQRNAAAIDVLKGRMRDQWSEYCAENAKLAFDRNAYSALAAALANEYYQSIGLPTSSDSIPDSIKEFHMLRGEATDWKNADDVRLGKGMWEKRQRQEVKRVGMENSLRAFMGSPEDMSPLELIQAAQGPGKSRNEP